MFRVSYAINHSVQMDCGINTKNENMSSPSFLLCTAHTTRWNRNNHNGSGQLPTINDLILGKAEQSNHSFYKVDSYLQIYCV